MKINIKMKIKVQNEHFYSSSYSKKNTDTCINKVGSYGDLIILCCHGIDLAGHVRQIKIAIWKLSM